MAGLMAAWASSGQGAEAGPGPSTTERRRKIPKVAVYVSGAAFAITTGLTLLILPYARQAARLNRIPTEFRSNRHLALPRPASSIASTPHAGATTANSDAAHQPDRDEPPKGEPMGGLLAFQAFGIATAIVFGSAGLGAWGISKLLGVNDMEGFAGKMREKLEVAMPGLTMGMRKYGTEPDTLGDFLDEMGKDPDELKSDSGVTLERPSHSPS